MSKLANIINKKKGKMLAYFRIKFSGGWKIIIVIWIAVVQVVAIATVKFVLIFKEAN